VTKFEQAFEAGEVMSASLIIPSSPSTTIDHRAFLLIYEMCLPIVRERIFKVSLAVRSPAESANAFADAGSRGCGAISIELSGARR
jgi:hypothetical protein